ncbi:MAG: hypothetical protein HY722_03580, partial [Planctomycetes bacterium]|nr:hypothetical protein [Planctomycetota bacterium]
MRGAGGRDRAGGVRLALRAAALLAAAVVLGVLASHEFPGLFGGPRTSTEVLAEIFRAPFEAMAEPARLLAERAPRQAVLLFLRALDLPEGTRGRLSEHVRSGRFEERSLPFLLYLHQLYGARSGDGDAALDLDYPGDEADTSAPAPAPAPARGSTSLRRQVEVALRLYDALFLRQRPGADERTPLRDRYDEAAYA